MGRCAARWCGRTSDRRERGATVAWRAGPRRAAPLSLESRPERSAAQWRTPQGLAIEHGDRLGIRREEYYIPPMRERQPYSEESRAKRRGRMESASDQRAAPQAHLVGMEAHRASGARSEPVSGGARDRSEIGAPARRLEGGPGPQGARCFSVHACVGHALSIQDRSSRAASSSDSPTRLEASCFDTVP